MPAAAPIPESRKKELEGFQRRKCSGHCLKRFLCVWLRHGQGTSAVETASSLGMKANTVRVAQRRFIAEGGGVFASHKRGPKNPRFMSFIEESAFLPPCPPELNPQEQAWGELKEKFFGNRFFRSIEEVVDTAVEGLRWLEARPEFVARLTKRQ